MLFIIYLIITLFVGLIAMIIAQGMDVPVGIFFDPRKWPQDTDYILVVMLLGYGCMFSFAIIYWFYKLCGGEK